jgi:hypothetical protein
VVAGGLHYLAHALGAADIAGIDAQAGGPRISGLDGAYREVDIGHDRHLRGFTIPANALVESSSGQDTE